MQQRSHPPGGRRRGLVRRAALLGALFASIAAAEASAQAFSLPPHFQAIPLPEVFNLPVGLVFAPDGSMLVIEKTGRVKAVDAQGVAQSTPFLDLSAEVNNDHDRGMLGIALHPGFMADGGASSWVYLLYTVSPVHGQDWGFSQDSRYSFSRLSRYRAVTNASGLVADPLSREVLIGHQLADGTVPGGIASLHNSHSNGSMRFADDGSLLVATGDGAHYDFRDTGGRDNPGFDDVVHPTTGLRGPTRKIEDAGALRSQDLRSLAGKILRIDPATGMGYPSNPFFDGDPSSFASRVWALGLRNPFRMDVVPGTGATDPALGDPGVITIGDVGWNKWEEMNISKQGGENFGWPCFEGPLPHAGYQGAPSAPSGISCADATIGTLTLPVIAWHHTTPSLFYPTGSYVDANGNPLTGFRGVCAIGGATYTGGSYPAEYVGRVFFGEYGLRTMRTIELDSNFDLVAVRDFATQTGGIVAIERHPLTGDLYCVQLSSGQILHIRWGANLAPTAIASATPSAGASPLSVQFNGAGSSDPEGDALTFDWDFGDGSMHSNAVSPLHVYTTDGNFTARLTVTDALGLSSEWTSSIVAGNLPPTAVIRSPLSGATYATPTTLRLIAYATDPEAGVLDYRWDVTLFHATHSHPGTFQANGPAVLFDIGTSPEDPDLLYYEIELTVTDDHALESRSHVYVYPRSNHFDVSGTALPIARVFELSPPNPTGEGNPDIEVIRDQRTVPAGSGQAWKQFDTFHGGDQGSVDWIGYELTSVPGAESRFVALSFQEGKRVQDGGWFADLAVEVRDQGVWSAVENLRISPSYPSDFTPSPGFTGFNFGTYRMDFDPQFGDAIRIRGTPGGSMGFVSCAELRAFGIRALPPTIHVDLTPRGRAIYASTPFVSAQERYDEASRSFALRDGARPPVGSTSELAEFRTAPSASPWFGYAFGVAQSFSRIEFQEGLDEPQGGAFASLVVEVQSVPGAPWQSVTPSGIAPAFTGANGQSYETFVIDFAPVSARAIRLRGAPAGAGQYASAGELRVLGPTPP